MINFDELIGRPINKIFQLRAYIYLARYLPLATYHKPNPILYLSCAGHSISTIELKDKTINPMWFNILTLTISIPIPLDVAPYIVGRIKNNINGPVIAEFTLSTKQARYMNKNYYQIIPKWFNLRDNENNMLRKSKLLASFQLLTSNEVLSYPLPKSIKSKYNCKYLQIIILGIKNLYQGFGIYNPYINIAVQDMLGDLDKIEANTEISSSSNKKNPIFATILHLPIAIPLNNDYKFAPTIEINVYDTGLIQGLGGKIGSGSINLQDIFNLQQSNKQNKKKNQNISGQQILLNYLLKIKNIERTLKLKKKKQDLMQRRLKLENLKKKKKLKLRRGQKKKIQKKKNKIFFLIFFKKKSPKKR